MADLSPTAAGVSPRPHALSAITLLREGFREVRAHWEAAFGLWAAGAGWAIGLRAIRLAQGSPRFHWSPIQVGQTVLSAGVAAGLAALTLRLFLAPGRGWWRPDRGFWTCVGLLILASLGYSTLGIILLLRLPHAQLATLELRLGLSLVAQIALTLIYARLVLWPIGLLMGEREMTPVRAWGLMRGQMVGFVVAAVIVHLPVLLVTPAWILATRVGAHGQPIVDLTWLGIATALLTPAALLMQRAMAAVIWRAKAGPGA